MDTKWTASSVIFFAVSLLFFSLPVGCVSTETDIWPSVLLRDQISELRDSCKMSDRNGFSADISIADQGSAKIDAVWDTSGNLDGQVINALGEDILNFRIDSAGILQSDASLKQEAILGPALDFLAELGTQKSRLLLCSGLFLAANEETGNTFGKASAKINFTLTTHSSKWRLTSRLLPVVGASKKSTDEIKIVTIVKKPDWLFDRTIATIEWQGKRNGKRMKPQSLTVNSAHSDVRLSILDFD